VWLLAAAGERASCMLLNSKPCIRPCQWGMHASGLTIVVTGSSLAQPRRAPQAAALQVDLPMCRLGNLKGRPMTAQPAHRQLTAVAEPPQGPVAPARSCVPLRMRSITISTADPFSGHPAPMLLRHAATSGGRVSLCGDVSATCCSCSRAIACQLLLPRPEVPYASKKGGQISS
jgi:hypothetical protein